MLINASNKLKKNEKENLIVIQTIIYYLMTSVNQKIYIKK